MTVLYKLMNALKRFDGMLFAATLLLMIIGLTAIYSVDLSRGDTLIFFPTQVIAGCIGMVLLFGAAFTHTALYEKNARLLYFGSILLLVLVLFFGVTIRGTTGWFRIAGFSFQPSETAKVGLIFIMSLLVAKWSGRYNRLQFLLSGTFLLSLPVLLILMQPDLGSSLVLMGIWFGVSVFAGIPKKYIFAIISTVFIVSAVSWVLFLKPYQKERIYTFINPELDPLGSGYNVTQSVIAIGSGGFWGRGVGFGSQSQLHFLPEAQTDFIFAVIGEELGFFGVSMLLLLFLIVLWRLMRIAWLSRSEFGAYMATGIAMFFFVQFLLNVGATIGLLPLTGVTLPFVSYGGTSLIINCFLIGIAESVYVSFGDVKRQLPT